MPGARMMIPSPLPGELKRLIPACTVARNPDLLMRRTVQPTDCAAKQRACRVIEEGVGDAISSHERAILPQVDAIWEMEGGTLKALGSVPR